MSSDFGKRPHYSRSPQRRPSLSPRPATAPANSTNWLSPWIELKYFSYNPAIFPRMIGAVSPDAQPGDLVHVYDKNGALFGAGFWNAVSKTPLRMVYHGSEVFSEEGLDRALTNAVSLRRHTLQLDNTTNAYRVVHGDSDGIGGLIVDRYADVLSLEVSTLGAWQRLNRWLPLLHNLCGTTRHLVHVDDNIARMEHIDTQHSPCGSSSIPCVKIKENGIVYEVNFDQGHKTGFFCDQRDNRLRFSTLVKGASVLGNGANVDPTKSETQKNTTRFSGAPGEPRLSEDKKPEHVEFDVVAESLDKKKLLVGECKWTTLENSKQLTAGLLRKANLLPFATNYTIVPVLFLKNVPKDDVGNAMTPEIVIELLK